ncbi:MAG: tyrosine-type recombinase/integrase [Acidihalobacter sp.]|uniref:tyrosine-type recombinase/integrase n=1 Tax=Acidihalobacter sp. TaxID=1872108 RepID=UPI00307F20EA
MGKLTVKQVENTKPGEREVVLIDGDGLQLRIYPSGVRSWQFRYRFGDKRHTMPLGRAEHVTLKQARTATQDARKLIDQGLDPIEEQKRREAEREAIRKAQESRRTFGQAVERWAELELAAGRKDRGAECMRSLGKDVLPTLGDHPLDEIRRGDLVDILDSIVSRGSRVQANHVFGDLKQFFNWCEARDWIERHPLRGVSKERIGGRETERDRILSPDELVELRDKLPAAHFEPQTDAAIWIMLSTLCRVGELIQARWEDVDLDAAIWRIPAGNSKNAKEHIVYLSPHSVRQFRALHERTKWSDWCLPSTMKDGEHVCMKSITRQLRDRMRDTAMSNRTKATGALILSGGSWTAHDLRRTGATLMGELGVLSEIIERCLNHVEPSKIKRTYQRHEYTAEKRDAWRRLGDYLDELLNHKARAVIDLRARR